MIEIIHEIDESDEDVFCRHWAARVWDESQLAQIKAIEVSLIHYAMTAWRPMNIAPPADTTLIGACDDGLVLLRQTQHGEWRTDRGHPHKAPSAWMPAPLPPKRDGRAAS